MVETDQQERGDGGQLPEDVEGDQPVGEHEAQHGAHEGQHEAEEPAAMWVMPEIGAGIEHDECADPEMVSAKVRLSPSSVRLRSMPKARQPGKARIGGLAGGDRRDKRRQQRKDRGRNKGQHQSGIMRRARASAVAPASPPETARCPELGPEMPGEMSNELSRDAKSGSLTAPRPIRILPINLSVR